MHVHKIVEVRLEASDPTLQKPTTLIRKIFNNCMDQFFGGLFGALKMGHYPMLL